MQLGDEIILNRILLPNNIVNKRSRLLTKCIFKVIKKIVPSS